MQKKWTNCFFSVSAVVFTNSDPIWGRLGKKIQFFWKHCNICGFVNFWKRKWPKNVKKVESKLGPSMLRNKIGPSFGSTMVFLLSFSCLVGESHSLCRKKQMCEKQKGTTKKENLDQVLTQRGHFWIKFWLYSIYIYMPETPPGGYLFRLQDVENAEGEKKNKGKKRQKEKKKKKLGNMKNPHVFVGVFHGQFYYKTGEKLRFLTKMCPPVGVSPIYIYIYPPGASILTTKIHFWRQ